MTANAIQHKVNGAGRAWTMFEVIRAKTGLREYYRSGGDGINTPLTREEFLAMGGNTSEMAKALPGVIADAAEKQVPAEQGVALRLNFPSEQAAREWVEKLRAAGIEMDMKESGK